MPGKNEIVAGIRLEGEKEFKQGLASINKEINETKSELKKTEAAYDGQANSLEALTAKNKILLNDPPKMVHSSTEIFTGRGKSKELSNKKRQMGGSSI